VSGYQVAALAVGGLGLGRFLQRRGTRVAVENLKPGR
jgi:hypothetical protein